MKPRIARWALATAMCAGIACGDRALTAPQVAGAGRPTSSATAGGEETVRLLKRTEELPAGLSASAMIGPRGGRIEIGQAGIQVEFPRGAVATPTLITVTAVGGANVAYRFEPHGLVFQAPVRVRQILHNTIAWKNQALAAELQGSYFERLLVDRSESYARSLERRRGNLKESGKVLEFSIEHFSGYMVSFGRAPVEVEIELPVDISQR